MGAPRVLRGRWLLATVAAAALAALTMLAACGAQVSGSGPTRSSEPSDPVALVGVWQVEGAAGVPSDERSALRLGAGELSWWRDCGVSFGSWRAGADLLLLDPGDVWHGSCPHAVGTDPSTTWLTRTTRFERDADGWRLLDTSGRQQARLRPGAQLTPRPGLDPSLAAPPTVDAAMRRALAEPAPLPTGLFPASATTVLGRWTVAGAVPTRSPQLPRTVTKPPSLSVAADGTWTGWDGCNASAGRWRVGEGGRLLVTAGPSTLIGCDGLDLPGLWASAARLGLDGRLLVLVDRDGHELARLSGPTAVPTATHGPVQR